VYGYPASCNNVISVGALDYLRDRSYYSTFNDQVDIAGPGGDTSVDRNGDGYRDGILAFGSNEELGFWQGTSMAAPNVSGAIAILYSLVPGLTSFQVDGLLADGHLTDDIGPIGKDDDFGFGALNIQKAVTRIISDEGLDFTYGTVSPGIYNMGVDINSFELEVSKIGDGELLVNQITSNIPSAVQISPTSVDSEGFGTYTVVIDRSSIPDGLYTTRITIPFSNDNASSMEISFQVGSDRENIPIPEIYVALINDDTGEGVRFGRFDMPEGFVSFDDHH
jgi:serine protease